MIILLFIRKYKTGLGTNTFYNRMFQIQIRKLKFINI